MSDYVMHMQLEKSSDFSICGKSTYTAHIRTTKDPLKVTCSRCLSRLKKKEVKSTVFTGEF